MSMRVSVSSVLQSILEIAVQLQLKCSNSHARTGHSISEIAVQLQPQDRQAEPVRRHSISEIAVQLQQTFGDGTPEGVIAFQKSRSSCNNRDGRRKAPRSKHYRNREHAATAFGELRGDEVGKSVVKGKRGSAHEDE